MFHIAVSPLLKLQSRAVGVLAGDVGTTANGIEVCFEDVGEVDDLSGLRPQGYRYPHAVGE